MLSKRPFPSIEEDIRPFWDYLKEGSFRLWHCRQCDSWYFPKAYCRDHECGAFFEGMEWDEASGRGKVFSFNIHYRSLHPGFVDEIPYVYALIELEEGPIIGSNVIECKPEEVKIGMPVEVRLTEINHESGEKFVLPLFRPVKDSGTE